MNWYEHLYMGEEAKKRRYGILQGLREGKLLSEVYVIMPPERGNNLLEIVPAPLLKTLPYSQRELFVIGVAVTYWEALKVAGQIVDELYHKTVGFCLEDLIQSDVEMNFRMHSKEGTC